MITVTNLDDNKQYIPVEKVPHGEFFMIKNVPNKIYQRIYRTAYNHSEFPIQAVHYPEYVSVHLRKGLEVFIVNVEIKVLI